MKHFLQNLPFALASAVLLGLAFPPIPTGITAFVGLVPFLWRMEKMETWWKAFRFSYLTFMLFNFATVYWVSGWSGDDFWLKVAGVATNLVHPLLFTVPCVVYYLFRKYGGMKLALAAFPFIYTSYEWLAHLPELSFPWLALSNTQSYDLHRIQFIAITGPFGATFWIVVLNVLCFAILHTLMGQGWTKGKRSILAAAAGIVLLLAVPEIYSRMVLNTPIPNQGEVRVGITQPDVDPYDKWGEGQTPMMKVQDLMRLYDSLTAQYDLDVVLMPETAMSFRLLTPIYEAEWRWLRRHIDSLGVPLMTGFAHIEMYEPGEGPVSAKKQPNSPITYDNFNSAMLVVPRASNVQVYKKSRLTPMSERIPYLDQFPFLQDAMTWGVGISSWGLGHDETVFHLPLNRGEGSAKKRVTFWPMICYETIYPEFVAGFVRRGSQFLCVITNDGWFGKTSGPYQLERYAVLRAIENRRAVARCANNGVSCFIDPYGRVWNETELYTRGTIASSIPLNNEITYYTRVGDWLPKLCVGVTVGLILLLIVSSAQRKRKAHETH